MSRTSRAAFAVALLAVALVGCRQDMHDQAKLEPYEESDFFADGRGSRLPIEGTVARGHLREDSAYWRGVDAAGQPLATMPVELSAELVHRGRERFDIFCSPCHDRTGNGRGMIVRRGFPQPQSFHQDRLRDAPDGYYFNVISNGFGRMSDYAAQVPVEDRWAIVAYIRALQLSQNAPLEALSAEDRAALSSGGATAGTDDETHDDSHGEGAH